MIVLGWFLLVLPCIALPYIVAKVEPVRKKVLPLLGCVLHGIYIGWTLFGR